MQRVLIIAFLILLGFFKAYSQPNGCLVSGNMVFFDGAVGGGNTYFTGGNYYTNYAGCAAGNSPSNSYYLIITQPSPSTPCYAAYSGIFCTTNPACYTHTGVKVTFARLYCPIDDYIWFLILPLSGSAFYFMRRNSRALISELRII